MISKILFSAMVLFFLAGCGVKGKPLPPLNPAPIGDGTLKGQRKKPVTPNVRTAPNEEKTLEGK